MLNNFEYKKSLGQNFLKDDNIIDKIVEYSDIDKDTLVIEIGPGAGSLSKKIVPLCGYAILYEIDIRLKSELNSVLDNYTNYEIIFGDFLEQNIIDLRVKYNYSKIYVIANLPYYITTPIITKVIDELFPDKLVIMIQEEVANRLCALEGSREYGMISVSLGSRYNIKKLFSVSRNCFIPVPNVDSAVIEMIKEDKLSGIYIDKFEEFIKCAFQFKRKNLRNNLKNYNVNLIEDILLKHGFSLKNRAEDIPVNVFIDIVKEI